MTTNDVATSSTPNELDLAFIIDATSSMGSYIHSAQQNMRKIIEDLILSEKCLLNVALILYRDHPPQDSTFIVQIHDFTDDAEEAKTNIDKASAYGGGDGPEAVAPALYAAVHTLSWRPNAVKIAVLIADAPPHGLDQNGDAWPNGDPSGHDPVECAASLAERSVTLYTIGCEPSATPYRDFYMALAFKTGGQYIPLNNSAGLASVIVGSAREEVSLERLIKQVHEEVMREAASRGGPVDETELTRRIHEIMQDGGAKVRRLKMQNQDGTTDIPLLTPEAEHLSTLSTLKEVREKWKRNNSTTTSLFGLPLSMAPTFGTTPSTSTLFSSRSRKIEAKGPRKILVAKRMLKRAKVVTPVVKRTIKKKSLPERPRGTRRSLRLELNRTNDETESMDDEEMDTTTTITTPPPSPPKPVVPVVKPAKLRTDVSQIELKEDELLDISQTRRLVRKCVARNKLKST